MIRSPYRSVATFAALSFALVSLGSSSASAQPHQRWAQSGDNELRVRFGAFTPDGGGEYFADKFVDFTGQAADFEDGAFAVEYTRDLLPLLDLVVSGGAYEGIQEQRYRDYEDDRGNAIAHTTSLEIDHLEAGLRLRLGPPHARLLPYVVGGVGLYSYRLSEDGDFIDFTPPPPTIFDDRFEAEGAAVGWFAAAGLQLAVTRNTSLFAEGRWRRAEDELGDDFSEFGTLDLSGRELALGVAWRF